MRRIALAAALLALVAVSCKSEINIALELNADGSGTAVFETGFDDEFLELVFQGEDPGDSVFEDNGLADVPGAQFDEYKEGEFTFYRARLPFESVDQLMEQAGGEGEDLFNNLSVTTGPDEVRVSGRLDSGDESLLGDSGEFEGFDPDILADTFAFHVRLKMPGKVIESNANRTLGDGTLEWDIPLTGGVLDVQAVSDPTASADGGGGVPMWLIVLIVVVVIGAIAFFVMNRRKGEQAVVAEPEAMVAAEAVEAHEETGDDGDPFS